MDLKTAQFHLKSDAFGNYQEIPVNYTCEGDNVSPPLQWAHAPPDTQSYVLIVDDPDAPDPKAPRRVFTHWIVYNIPPSVTRLSEGLSALPRGAHAGLNDQKDLTWYGPCPPTGKHRYFYKLYALDSTLTFPKPPTKMDIEEAMKGHILAKTEMVGLYEKSH